MGSCKQKELTLGKLNKKDSMKLWYTNSGKHQEDCYRFSESKKGREQTHIDFAPLGNARKSQENFLDREEIGNIVPTA